MSLRVGRISALNMYPLYHHLERHCRDDVVFTDGVPTTLNEAVIRGDLDVSAMSSIAFARHADRLELLPVASITAAGAVDSIQVFSRVPFEELTRVEVTPHSATSVALLRVLAGPHVAMEPQAGPARDALTRADGVLLIGDEALEALREGWAPYSTDLAQLWQQRTALPMVFAVWAARRDLPPDRRSARDALADVLRGAQAAYLADPARVVDAAAERFPFPRPFIASYLARLSYGFGDAERAALAHFYACAVEAGVLDTAPALAADSGPARRTS